MWLKLKSTNFNYFPREKLCEHVCQTVKGWEGMAVSVHIELLMNHFSPRKTLNMPN